jgi:cytosine/adenosine deaminase-related metal-dependent hydrolase
MTRRLAFSNVNVIDGLGGVIYAATVTLDGAKSESVTPGDSAALPEDVQVIDGNGGWLMPGLINFHDHLCNKWLRTTPASDYQGARLKRRHSNPGTHALEIRSLLIPTLRRTDPHPEVLEGYSAAASV